MIVDMAYYSLPLEEPVNTLDQAPLYVRQPLMRMQRASRALGIFRRRGWNDSAVAHAHRIARADFQAAVRRWEHEDLNPKLF